MDMTTLTKWMKEHGCQWEEDTVGKEKTKFDIPNLNAPLLKFMKKHGCPWEEESSPDVYFISGHLNLSQQEFDLHYRPLLDAIDKNASFIVGDAAGADTMAQQYLFAAKKTQVKVYHMFASPRNNIGSFNVCGGFLSDEERDCQMTRDSSKDICWIRSVEESKKIYGSKFKKNKISGTEKNLLRRKLASSGFK